MSSESNVSAFTYCKTAKMLDSLTAHLQKRRSRATAMNDRYIFLDCEFGEPNSRLTLIKIGIGEAIYLVDVVTLPDATDNLKPFLSDPQLAKYVWDGRKLFTEWQKGHGVTLRGLVDLQLAYFHTQPELPAGRITQGSMLQAAEELEVVQPDILARIRSRILLPKNGLTVVEARNKREPGQGGHNSSTRISRPLLPSFLNFVAYDIVLLRLLLAKLMERLPEATWADIREESLVYVTSDDTIGRDRESTSDAPDFLPEGALGCCKTEDQPAKSSKSTRYKGVIWLRYPQFDEMTDSSGCEYSSYESDD